MRAKFNAVGADKAHTSTDRLAQFGQFWQEQWAQHPQDIPFDYETFTKLEAARARGEPEFRKAFTMHLQELANDKPTRGFVPADFLVHK